MRRFLNIPCCALGLLILAATAYSQPVDTAWTRNYWNGYFDSLNWVAPTSDGGFVLVGASRAPGESQSDINLIKTDASGNPEWNVVIGDTTYQTGFHVLETYDGGYLISANSDATGSGGGATWIVKTNSVGDTLWTYLFNPEDRAGFPLYAIETIDSGYAVTGRLNLSGLFNEAFILRLDRNGNYVDYRHYNDDPYLQDGWFMAQLPDSGFILAGHDDNYYTTGYDFWAMRTNKDLNVIWDSSYALTGSYDEVHGGCMVDDGIVMVGTAGAYGFAHKIDFDGNTMWSKNISYNFTNEANNSVCPTADGGFMVGGWIWVTSHRRDFSFIKLNPDGDALWQFTVGGPEDDNGNCLLETADGGFVMAGTSYSFVNGTSSYLVKVFDYANTPIGSNVQVPASDSVTVTFSNVSFTGTTTAGTSSTGPTLPGGFVTVPMEPATFYEISSSAEFSGNIEVCIEYDQTGITGDPAELQLWHFNGTTWEDITSYHDMANHLICGVTSSLSPFVVAAPVGLGVIDDDEIRPGAYRLFQNHPNPFNAATVIRFDLPQGGKVTIDVLNPLGRLVTRLADREFEAGSHVIEWNGQDDYGGPCATGIYFYRLKTEFGVISRRMLLLK